MISLAEKLRKQLQIQESNQNRLQSRPLTQSGIRSQNELPLPLCPSVASSTNPITNQLERLRQLSQNPINIREFQEDLQFCLGGEIRKTSVGSFLYFAKQHELSVNEGSHSLNQKGELVRSFMGLLVGKQIECEPSQIAFLDTETTGLSGGTGTVPFLVGVGSWNMLGFSIEQFFMRDFHEERALLQSLQERLSQIQILVTFNGKSFDLPLLESRFVLARQCHPLARLVHLDLLHPARRLWRLRLRDCSLGNLEKHLLGLQRENDIPGNLIPHLYFNYTRTGIPKGIKTILAHNQQDIKTLANLTLRTARILLDFDPTEDLEAEELFSAGRYFQALGKPSLSLKFNQAVLRRDLQQELKVEVLSGLAEIYKSQTRYPQAVALWESMLSSSQKFHFAACENLAIFYEHRAKNPTRALELTELAIDRITNEEAVPEKRFLLQQWLHRRDRLQRKMRNGSASIVTSEFQQNTTSLLERH